MTALTTMFDFLIVFLRFISTSVFGGSFYVGDFVGIEKQRLAEQIILQISNGSEDRFLRFSGVPICQLFIGIVVFGAVIGLAKRLIKG